MAMAATYTTFAGMVVHQRKNGVDTELISDPLGSVVKTKDATGNETSRTEYWPYGEVQSSTGSNPTPFGFVGTLGYYRDLATRLYVRARYLRPDQGRWQTVDPLWPDESAYGYAAQAPALFLDYSGAGPFGFGGGWGIVLPGPSGHRWFGIPWDIPVLFPPPPPIPFPELPNFKSLCPVVSAEECKDCLDTLYEKMRKRYPDVKGDGGKGNSLRHCIGACTAKRECGSTCAEYIYLHEPESWFRKGGIRDSKKDMRNNGIGFGIADGSWDCVSGCYTKWVNGKLW